MAVEKEMEVVLQSQTILGQLWKKGSKREFD
jgi:hypothetical protein